MLADYYHYYCITVYINVPQDRQASAVQPEMALGVPRSTAGSMTARWILDRDLIWPILARIDQNDLLRLAELPADDLKRTRLGQDTVLLRCRQQLFARARRRR